MAPQITPVTVAGSAVSSASLTATRQYLIGFLNSVSSSIVSTWATIDAADVVADLLDRLDLEAGRGEPPADLLRVDRRGDRRVLAQPGNGYSHRR